MSYSKKTPKSQKQESDQFTWYYKQGPVNIPNPLYVTSIDPSFKNGNYAMRMEKLDFNSNGELSNITPLIFTRLNLGEHPHIELYRLFDSSKELLLKTNILLIERQLPENYQNIRIQQHTESWFFIELSKNTNQHFTILEMDPRFKGKALGAPKNLNSTGLKAWAIDEARRILVDRGDETSLKILDSCKTKKDDLSDTVVQSEAFYKSNLLRSTSNLTDLYI